MGADSKIEWCDHTFNPWIGCAKVSPGCDHCYAEAWAKRYGQVEWGTGAPRKLTSDANWKQPVNWNVASRISGKALKVFCASLADVFDNEVPTEWRDRLWELIHFTPYIDWLLLTKRIGNVKSMLPVGWGNGWNNVWLGASIVNQAEAERDIPKLAGIPAKVRFLSMEPLLGAVDLRALKVSYGGRMNAFLHDRIHWVIAGGESGKEARPMHPDWAKGLRDQCAEFHIPFFFKQWGEWGSDGFGGSESAKSCFLSPDGTMLNDVFEVNKSDCLKPCLLMFKDGKKRNGRLLGGVEWNGTP